MVGALLRCTWKPYTWGARKKQLSVLPQASDSRNVRAMYDTGISLNPDELLRGAYGGSIAREPCAAAIPLSVTHAAHPIDCHTYRSIKTLNTRIRTKLPCVPLVCAVC